ncbi:MAG: prepilin-type N-terminal cleavage/methylation domain-containing protein [Candidatus Omnitrophica bacterium]|nr:prepilin-type N-terminal cleavage/methylation domain-containing protein [Candidatus Omnitrophota bacterium]
MKSFTLIELMVSIAILALGIVGVLRSFISMSYALDVSANRIEAVRVLEAKMDGIEEEMIKDPELELGADEEQVTLRNRPAQYRLEVTEFEMIKDEKEPLTDKVTITEAKVTLAWKEGQINKDATLATYFQKKTAK